MKRSTMKLDAARRSCLSPSSVANGRPSAAASASERVTPATQRYVPQRPSLEYSSVEQGSRSDPEAGACGGPAVPDADLESVAQVRERAPEGSLIALASVGRQAPSPTPASHRERREPSSADLALKSAALACHTCHQAYRLLMLPTNRSIFRGHAQDGRDAGGHHFTASQRYRRSETPGSVGA